MLLFDVWHPRRDQNLRFWPLSGTTSIFIWESPTWDTIRHSRKEFGCLRRTPRSVEGISARIQCTEHGRRVQIQNNCSLEWICGFLAVSDKRLLHNSWPPSLIMSHYVTLVSVYCVSTGDSRSGAISELHRRRRASHAVINERITERHKLACHQFHHFLGCSAWRANTEENPSILNNSLSYEYGDSIVLNAGSEVNFYSKSPMKKSWVLDFHDFYRPEFKF